MIGRIDFEWAEEPASVELGDDLKWSGPKDLARWLNQIFDPRDSLSPQQGMPGYASFYAAAEFLGGSIDVPKPPRPEERDAIY
jgi:hypothetical protein